MALILNLIPPIALSIRYEQVAACQEIADEVPWFLEFRELIETESEKLSRIRRYALLNLIHYYLEKAIEHINSNYWVRMPRGGRPR